MVRFFSRIVLSFLSNLIGFFVATQLFVGFIIQAPLTNLIIAAGFFTAINMFIRPFIKLILTPVIVLTLGIFSIVINAAMLWLLDFLSQYVTITDITSLIYATLLISVINVVVNLSARFSTPRTL
ncbi:MAG: phage holin family protein [bacterium]|nr:phage holin family protein [bacterium]